MKNTIYALLALSLLLAACNGTSGNSGALESKCNIPSECGADQDCVAGVCVAKPSACASPCERGVCSEEGSTRGQCVNKGSCAEDKDCLADNYCEDKVCKTKADICEKCSSGGICDEGNPKGDCKNKSVCNNDIDCIGGYFCSIPGGESSGICQANLCDSSQKCSRGECKDKLNGGCDNREPCEHNKDCVDKYVCVNVNGTNSCKPLAKIDDGGALIADSACKEGTCPGNQVCEANGLEDTGVSCVERAGGACENTLDCTEKRICHQVSGGSGDKECTNEKSTCTNGSDSSPVPYDGKKEDTLCSENDTDIYSYSVSKKSGVAQLVTVELKRKDPLTVGYGPVTVELKWGDVKKEVTLESKQESVMLTADVSAGNAGSVAYTITVKAGDLRAPLPYTLEVNTLVKDAYDSCKDVTPISFGEDGRASISGNIEATAERKSLTATCEKNSKELRDKVYSFELTEEKFVYIRVTGTGSDTEKKPVVSLKKVEQEDDCLSESGEVECRRLNNTARIEKVLEPGKYQVLVQAPSADQGLNFNIDIETKAKSCTEDVCSDEKLFKCNAFGTAAEEVPCASCAGGTCSTIGTCASPIPVVAFPTKLEGELTALSTGGADCSSKVGKGNTVVTKVKGRVGEIIEAEFDAEFDATLYLLPVTERDGSCGNVCPDKNIYQEVELADSYKRAHKEKLFFTVGSELSSPSGTASTDETKEYFVVARAKKKGDFGKYTLSVNVSSKKCEPNERICSGKDVKICNEATTDFELDKTCLNGCSTGVVACPDPYVAPNNRCDVAEEVVFADGVATIEGDIKYYSNELSGQVCGKELSAGKDAFYKFTTKEKHRYVFTVFGQFEGKFLLLDGEDCSKNMCITGVDVREDEYSHKEKKFEYRADKAKTLKLIVESNSKSEGKFEVKIEEIPVECFQGETQCTTDGKLQTCTKDYTWGDAVDCSAGYTCSKGGDEKAACRQNGAILKDGQTCAQAAELTFTDGSYTEVEVDLSGYGNTFDAVGTPSGECGFRTGDSSVTNYSTGGNDKVFDVSLLHNEVLEVLVEKDGGRDYGTIVYLLDDGCSLDSCKRLTKGSTRNHGSFLFHNASSDTFKGKLVVDLNNKTHNSAKFKVKKYAAECTAPVGQAIGCDGNTLKVCQEGYRTKSKTCLFGCATDGAEIGCALPKNDLCADRNALPDEYTITLGDGDTITKRFSTDLNEYHPSVGWPLGASQCDSGFGALGEDAFYKVVAKKGDIVTAKVTGFNAPAEQIKLFALSGSEACSENVEGSCLGKAATIDAGREGEITFIMPADSAYVYVSLGSKIAANREVSRSFNLDVTVWKQKCTPDSFVCNNNEIVACDGLGKTSETFSCPFGCDTNKNACNKDADKGGVECSATKSDAHGVAAGEEKYYYLSNHVQEDDSKKYKGLDQYCSEATAPYSAAAASFIITNGNHADNTATITVEPVKFGKYAKPELAVAVLKNETCDVENDKCKAFNKELVDGKITTSVVVPANGNVIVLVGSQAAKGAFKFSYTIGNKQCDDDYSECSGNDRKFCNGGQIATETCTDGCGLVNSKAVCQGLSCEAPIKVGFGEATDDVLLTGEFNVSVSETSRVEYAAGAAATCRTFGETGKGPERVFLVKGKTGDKLTVRAVRRDGDDAHASIHVLDKKDGICTKDWTMLDGCLDKSEFEGNGEDREFSYTFTKEEELYIVIDSQSVPSTGTDTIGYTFDIKRKKCDPSTPVICENNTVKQCVDEGRLVLVSSCECTNGNNGCNAEPNDTCSTTPAEDKATVIGPSGGFFSGDMRWDNDNVRSTSCGGNKTYGSDVLYKYAPEKDSLLEAWASAPGTLAVYAIEGCLTGEQDSCFNNMVASEDEGIVHFGPLRVEAGKVIYLVLDRPEVNPFESFPFELLVHGKEYRAQGDENNTCDNAKEVTDGGAITISDINQTKDNWYSIQLENEDTLKVEMTSRFKGKISLYNSCNASELASESVTYSVHDQSTKSKTTLEHLVTNSNKYYVRVQNTGSEVIPDDMKEASLVFSREKKECTAPPTACADGVLEQCGESIACITKTCSSDGTVACDDLPKGIKPKCGEGTMELFADGKDKVFVKGDLKKNGDAFYNMQSLSNSTKCGGFEPNRAYEHVVVFRAELEANEKVDLTLKAQYGASLFVTKNPTCGDNNGRESASCVAFSTGKQGQATDSRTIFTAVEAGRYYIIIGNHIYNDKKANNPFTLKAVKVKETGTQQVSCNQGEVVSCEAGKVKKCNEHGDGYVTTDCEYGCNLTGNECQVSGHSCDEAITLVDGDVVDTNFGVSTGDTNKLAKLPTTNLMCPVDKDPLHLYRYYKVNLKQGETLTVSIKKGSKWVRGNYVAVLSSCTSSEPFKDNFAKSCVAINKSYMKLLSSSTYTASVNGDVYFVVIPDSKYEMDSSDKYTVQVNISKP